MKNVNSTEASALIKTEKTLLVDIFATWCGPCTMMKPELEKVSANISDVTFVALDSDQNQDFCTQYKVSGLPTLLLFKSGTFVGSLHGFQNAKAIENFLVSNV